MRANGLAIIFVLVVAGITSLAATAQDKVGPSDEETAAARHFVEQMANEAIAILSNKERTEDERREVFRVMMLDSFAVDYMGRAALGLYNRRATPSQKLEYTNVFDDFMLETLLSRLSLFNDEDIVVVGHRAPGKIDIFVETHIISGSDVYRVDWRVRRIDGKLQIIDVHIEGVSMIVTNREEFSSIAFSKGVDGLITALRKKTLERNAKAFGAGDPA